jgi:hypothetical protein
MTVLIFVSDGKQVSIEGRLGDLIWWGRADDCHSGFCFDSSMREGRRYGT